MKTKSRLLSIGFLLLFPLVSTAQQKYEREFRIKSEIVPQSARAFIDSIGADSKIKWYRETNPNSVSIEAKFKLNKKKFSVEFDTLGSIQDVEFIVKPSEILPPISVKIEHQLDSLYQKWKFQKIQIQYTGKPKEIIASIHQNEPTDAVKIAYEIVLKGKALGNTQLFEITFNEEGELLDILQIVQDKADHLEY